MRAPVVLVALLLATPLALALAPPSAPTGLVAATGASPGVIELNWTPPSSSGGSPVAGYRLYRSLSPTGLTHYLDLGNVTAFHDTDVPDAAPRYYRVSAVNGDGEGPLSSVVEGRAKAVPSAPVSPNAATGPARSTITLSWGEPLHNGTLDILGYQLYVALDPAGPFALLASPTSPGYVHGGLGDNETRHYQVAALNALGEGDRSAVFAGRTPGPPRVPQNVSAAFFPGFGIDVDWDPPADDGGLPLLHYDVHRAVNDGPFVFRQRTHAIVPKIHDETCPLLATCRYIVRATNVVGSGEFSAPVNATGDAPISGLNPF